MRCYYCNTENQNDAKFCRSCGKPFPVEDVDWWKSLKMIPVSQYCFRPSLTSVFFMVITITPILLLSLLCFVIFMGDIITSGHNDKVENAFVPIIGAILIVVLYNWFKNKVLVNKVRKSRKELLDTDFIQTYNNKDETFVFIARGNSTCHKFGLFDLKKVRLIIPPLYEELKWAEKDKMLSAIKNGVKMMIDINGNEFK